MKTLLLAALFAPLNAHAAGEACVETARSMVQFEYDNVIRYAHESNDPEDRKFAACAGVPLRYEGATAGDSNGYTYYKYSFSADCGRGVRYQRSQELYPSLHCEIRGE